MALNAFQERLSKIRRGATSAALTLVIALVLGVVASQPAQAQTFTVLYNFPGSSDGATPYGALVQDRASNLYGTTVTGGGPGVGVVFKLDSSGKETVLHTFAGPPDGVYPFAGLLRDKSGNLYGTTEEGGASAYGMVFKVDTSGNETVLYSFAGGTTDGCYPFGGLIQDKSGNLYGTTELCGAFGYGTVFKLNKKGKETVLHSFAGGASDGQYPLYTSLLMDTQGRLYGVTQNGGAPGAGVLYKLSKGGDLTLLHSFAGGARDGCFPLGAPVMDKAGDFYGTSEACGSSNLGTVWKVNKKGTETILHSFAGGSSDGEYPLAGVILDPKGNMYGNTEEGGSAGEGTVYKLSKGGTLTLLHGFTGSDGEFPIGGLLRSAKGVLYGTTASGGASYEGTVWSIK